MIYLCTLFFNEFDLLDLKIAEELDQVDQMIIAESNQTFRGNPKPLYLKDNPKYQHPKIKLVFLENQFHDFPEDATVDQIRAIAIANEAMQRNKPLDIINLQDDDILIGTDLDEIIPKEDYPEIIDCTKEASDKYLRHARLQMHHHFYKINLMVDSGIEKEWRGPVCSTGKVINSLPKIFEGEFKKANRQVEAFFKVNIDTLRQCPHNYCPQIPTNGRHFSFLHQPEQMSYKLQNYALAEFDNQETKDLIITKINNMEHIIYKTKDGNPIGLKKIAIDNTYPKTILDNMDYWKNYMI